MSKQDLEQDVADLEAKLLTAKKRLGDYHEFLSEGFAVSYEGTADFIHSGTYSSTCYSRSAKIFKERAQAQFVEGLNKESRAIAQYLYKEDPNYKPDWDDEDTAKCEVYSDKNERWRYNRLYCDRVPGAVYLPEHVANKLVDDLNSGVYSLE